MICLNLLDADGNVLRHLPDATSIKNYFNGAVDDSSAIALMMDLMTNQNRITVNDIPFYFHTTNISNTNGTIVINYSPLT